MVQLDNQISLYKQLTDELLEKVGIFPIETIFSYDKDGKDQIIPLDDEYENIFTVNKYDSEWNPADNELRIEQSFRIKNPSFLYGYEGLTVGENLIGLAVHIHSRKSNFQKTIKISTIKNVSYPLKITFYGDFEAGSLRGDVELDYFLYLDKIEKTIPTQATEIGMVLSSYISSTNIIVDGDGSVFPMSEFHDPKGPLWKLEQNWADPLYDSFDISNINLKLNVAHPLFKNIKDGKTKMSQLMMIDIMVQAMALIIQQVNINREISEEELNDATPDSILSAVSYWISSFNVDTTSNTTIANSLRDHWHREIARGWR